jgi:hypothetical protein
MKKTQVFKSTVQQEDRCTRSNNNMGHQQSEPRKIVQTSESRRVNNFLSMHDLARPKQETGCTPWASAREPGWLCYRAERAGAGGKSAERQPDQAQRRKNSQPEKNQRRPSECTCARQQQKARGRNSDPLDRFPWSPLTLGRERSRRQTSEHAAGMKKSSGEDESRGRILDAKSKSARIWRRDRSWAGKSAWDRNTRAGDPDVRANGKNENRAATALRAHCLASGRNNCARKMKPCEGTKKIEALAYD